MRSSDQESYSGVDRFAQIHSPVRLRFCNSRLGCGMGFTVGFQVFVLIDGGHRCWEGLLGIVGLAG